MYGVVVAGKVTPEDVMLVMIPLQEALCGFQGAGGGMACRSDDAEMLGGELDLGGRRLRCHWRHRATSYDGNWVLGGEQ